MKLLTNLLMAFALSLAACATPVQESPASPARTVAFEGESLVVVDRAGASHDLSALLKEGHPVVLVFWQSWCGSCLAEAPQLAKDSEQWGQQLNFFGVVPGPSESVDEPAIDRVIKQFGLPHPQVRDTDLSLTKRFQIEGTPTILVLGPQEQVLYRSHDLPADWSKWAPARD